MGILKDAILAAIQQEHPDAHWVENEKTHMIESTAQAKYNDVRRVERNYTKGVHKARKEAHNGDILVINDNGKDVLDSNETATEIAHKHNAILGWDYICGDVVMCKDEEVQ